MVDPEFYEELMARRAMGAVGHGKPSKDTGGEERLSYFKRGDRSEKADDVLGLSQVVDRIRSCEFLEKQVGIIRKIRAVTPADKAKKSRLKASLPSVAVSIEILHGAQRGGIQFSDLVHTGLIQADFDEHPSPAELIEELTGDRYVRAAFRSASEKAKAFFKVERVATSQEHAAAFDAVAEYCLDRGYGAVDGQVKAVNSLCYLSSDPMAVLKPATPLSWTLKPKQPKASPSGARSAFTGAAESIEGWLARHQVKPIGSRPTPNGLMHFVKCPWIHEHGDMYKDAEAAVWFRETVGFCFKCLHDHCKDRGWEEFRQKVAPRETATQVRRDTSRSIRSILNRRNY